MNWRSSFIRRLLRIISLVLLFCCLGIVGIACDDLSEEATPNAQGAARKTSAILLTTPMPSATFTPNVTLRPDQKTLTVVTGKTQIASTATAVALAPFITPSSMLITSSSMLASTPISSATSTQAPSGYITNAQKVNARACASMNCESVAVLDYRTVVEVLGSENGWQKVRLPTGRIAYVWANYLSFELPSPVSPTLVPTQAPTEFPAHTRYVASSRVNVRVCASVECEVVTSLRYGASFEALAQQRDASSRIWYSFRSGGETVWIAGWLTSVTRPVSWPTAAPNVQPTAAWATQPPPVWPTSPSVVQPPVIQPTQPPPVWPTSPPMAPPLQWNCLGDRYNCGDFSTCSQVMSYWNACSGDPSRLDGDNDGIPCEALCGG